MKGIAIIAIVLHNLIHLIHPITENEFSFNLKNTDAFLSHLLQLHENLVIDIFSFLGWYGICIFLFLSGYGLTIKYENNKKNDKIRFWAFFKGHTTKLFLLMIGPFIIYLILYNSFDGIIISAKEAIAIFAQIFMISNLYCSLVHPGVFWFFGLMLQLYIIYHLFIYKKSSKNILFLIVLQFLIISISFFYLDNILIKNKYLDFILSSCNLLHNAIGWLLPFSFGIIYARHNLNILSNSNLKNILLFISSSILLIISNLNIFSWQLSPIFAILAAIYLNTLIKPIKFINKFFIYIGSISSFIFATHPLIRYIYLQITYSSDFLPILLYLIICIIIGICYKLIHNKLFHK